MKGTLKLDQDKWIVVTGGAGFIGSCLIRYLNDAGYNNLIVVDDLGQGSKWKNLVGKRFAEIVPIGEIFDWLSGREDEVQAILHMGANSSTVEPDADLLLDLNTRYTCHLIEFAIDHNIRMIYASSAATYGNGEQGFSDDADLMDRLHPLNMYGYSKHLVDLWVKKMGLIDRVVGLKYFNVFGPNEAHKGRMSSVIPQFVRQIQEKGYVKLFKSSNPDYKDGGQMRDFIYVKDVAAMTCSFLGSESSGIYNIGRGIPTTWNVLTSAIFKALGKPEKIEYIEMPEDLVGKYQDYTCATMDKFARHLPDWVATSIGDAVADYVNHHLLLGQLW